MKKLNLALAAVAALTMASCSSDEPAVRASQDGATTFTLTIPANAASRAMGDGQDIVGKVNLNYSVFQIDATDPTAVGTFVTSGTETTPFQKDNTGNTYSTTLSLNLAKGQTYNVVFWAANSSAPYTWDANNATVSINYGAMAINNDLLDAYFGTAASVTPGTAASATLKRPFAQVNLATSDLSSVFVEKAYGTGAANLRTAVKVAGKDLCNELNLFTGAATNNNLTGDVIFAAKPVSGQTLTINSVPYSWLTMDYLLVNANQSVADCEWTISGAANDVKIPVPACPVQRNYQTNVYGALLTNPTSLQVTIDPAFDGTNQNEYQEPDPWADFVAAVNGDGKPAIVPAGQTYSLHDALTTDNENHNVTFQIDGTLIADGATQDAMSGQVGTTIPDGSTVNINMSSTGKLVIPAGKTIMSEGQVTINGGTIENTEAAGASSSMFFNSHLLGQTMTNLQIKNTIVNLKSGTFVQSGYSQFDMENVTINTSSPLRVMLVQDVSFPISYQGIHTFTNVTINSLNGLGGGIVLQQAAKAVFENCHIHAGKTTFNLSNGKADRYAIFLQDGSPVQLTVKSGEYTLPVPAGYTGSQAAATPEADCLFVLYPYEQSVNVFEGGKYVINTYRVYKNGGYVMEPLPLAAGKKWQQIANPTDGLYWEVVDQ